MTLGFGNVLFKVAPSYTPGGVEVDEEAVRRAFLRVYEFVSNAKRTLAPDQADATLGRIDALAAALCPAESYVVHKVVDFGAHYGQEPDPNVPPVDGQTQYRTTVTPKLAVVY